MRQSFLHESNGSFYAYHDNLYNTVLYILSIKCEPGTFVNANFTLPDNLKGALPE